ncbi:MAG: hypothetical protein MJ105_07470 [Lachnospiraceae bacterium]|nr:hypothetical protein [Lachnospiraceae bacterium]
MGKVSVRRSGIIEYLSEHGCVEREELWTHFGISENRLCEDLKALQVNGYQFDSARPKYISLLTVQDPGANIYEPITTSVLRKWFLLAWVSICGEMHTDLYYNMDDHIGQKKVYDSLCKLYSHIYKPDDPKKLTYTLNTFHRDVRELCRDGELSCDTNQLFKEKFVFRQKDTPTLVIIKESLVSRILFALNELDQNNPHVQSLRKKLFIAYPNSDLSDSNPYARCQNPKIKSVYDRISTLVAFTSITDSPYKVDYISQNTGLPAAQIRKDFKALPNNIGRRLFSRSGFKTSIFLRDMPKMSILSNLYSGKNHRILYLPAEEYQLYKALRNLSFILGEDCNMHDEEKVLMNYGGKTGWYMDVEDLWYDSQLN